MASSHMTDRQQFKMAASVDETSKWSLGVMKLKMAANDAEIQGQSYQVTISSMLTPI